MRSVFVVCYLICIAQLSLAQNHVEIGEPFPHVEATKKEYYVRGDNSFTLKILGGKIIFQKFDNKNLSEISRIETILPRKSKIERFVEFDDKIILFYSLELKSEKKHQLFAKEFIFETGQESRGDLLVITSSKKVTSYDISSMSYRHEKNVVKYGFRVYTSYDKSKVFVEYCLEPEFRDDNLNTDIIGMFVFDDKLQKIWGGEKTMPYTEALMHNISYSVDGLGRVHLLTQINSADVNEGYESWIFEDLDKTSKKPLDLNKDQLYGRWIYEGPNHEIIYSGTNDKTTGLFFKAMIQPDGTYTKGVYHDIPLSFMDGCQGKSNKNRYDELKKNNADTIFPYLEIRNIEVLANGDMLIIGEQLYTEVYNQTENSGTISSVYADIVIGKILRNGDLAWLKRLPKNQAGGEKTETKSIKHIWDEIEKCHYIVYVDVIENIDLSNKQIVERYYNNHKGFLTVYKVDNETGDFTKQNLFGIEEVNNRKLEQFAVNKIVQSGPNELLIEFYEKRKGDVLVKVKMK